MASNERRTAPGIDMAAFRDDRTATDIQRWVEAHRSECGLVYIKKGREGAPLNFNIARHTVRTGDWSIDLKRQPIAQYLVYHRLRPGEGDVWTGRYVSSVPVGDRFAMNLTDVRGPTRVALTFRELTGVKEPEKGIRYADRTATERKSKESHARGTETGGTDLPDSEEVGVIKRRRGQPAFRKKLLVAWRRRCAVTESQIVDLLEAAHIRPHREKPDYRTANGLLLRADIHTLFDLELLSIDEALRVHIAPELGASEYAELHGTTLARLPIEQGDRPSVEALRERHEMFLERWRKASL